MVKKGILLLMASVCMAQAVHAQVCGTDALHREFIERDPKVAEIQQALDQYIRGAQAKTTGPLEDYLAAKEAEYQAEIAQKMYISVVVHVIHDYGAEYVKDDDIRLMIKNLNDVYAGQNSDLSAVIPTFQPYIGNMNIEFRLARKDPQGNPTTGITRRQSYLTKGGDEQAKFGQWDPSRYMNIWIENVIGRGVEGGTVLAYATLPAGAAQFPYSDGIMVAYNYINGTLKTMEHEVGHYLNLYHPWNSGLTGAGQQPCGDDEVDDTPPTVGHQSICPLADSVCATGYHKEYFYVPDSNADPIPVIVDYPDTTNVQNIMDYSSCPSMFTKQQVIRSRAALKSSVANRNKLIDPFTHTVTGIMEPENDLPPVPAFSVDRGASALPFGSRTYFLCEQDKSFRFRNQSWRDTITSIQWEFPTGTPSTSTAQDPVVTFNQPGWATVKLTATGNNTGSATIEETPVYVASKATIQPLGYIQEFTEGENGADQYPTFNYYNNSQRWEMTSATGYYDNTSMVFHGYDGRTFPNNYIGSPAGDYDDFFTPAFDLSGMTSGHCNLNFMYSGAYRTVKRADMNDVLEIAYSTNCGDTWVTLDSMKGKTLANKGTYTGKYRPLWTGDWELKSIELPENARKERVFFRFRYRSTADENNIGVGNYFYIDRLNISNNPLGINTLVSEEAKVAVVPNPTSGNAHVVVQSAQEELVKVQVVDITGKLVYETQAPSTGSITRIEIPASAISVKGIYMVKTISGAQIYTQKLVSQ